MKKIVILLFTAVYCQFVSAQMTVHDSSAFLDINMIKAKIYTGGINFLDKYDSVHPNYYEYPANSGKHTILSSALWIGGLNSGKLYLAGDLYQNGKRDFYPGPVMDSVAFQTTGPNWNKVWKINKPDIDYHIAHWNDIGYVMPASVSQWPAYGIPALGINYALAPFVDSDSDGFYTPANGDYPKIRGDQAIYFIYNDSAFRHTQTFGRRMGVEVHAMAYAYNSNPQLDKTVFMNYMIYNRSNRVYDSLYVGNFSDIDIGFAFDDYMGCDTLSNSFYNYNGMDPDQYFPSAFPYVSTVAYGSQPPAQGVTLLNKQMTSFMFLTPKMWDQGYSPDGGPYYFFPSYANDYFLLMNAYWTDSTHQLNYGVYGHPSIGDTIYTNYCLPSSPCSNHADSAIYNEITASNPPGDRRGLGSSGPYTLSPGQFLAFDYAYVTADSISDSCGLNINNLINNIWQVRSIFSNYFPSDGHDLALGIETENSDDPSYQFNVYPNPSSNKITFTTNLSNKKLRLDILDINGRLIQSYEFMGSRKEINISNFDNGVYILKISSADQNSFIKFIKM